MSDTAACDALSCDKKPDPRCPWCKGTGRIDVSDPPPLKALTLYQPWGWLMLYGPKRIENRDWKPPAATLGHRIWVHQGKKWDAEGAAYIATVLPQHAYGNWPPLARAVGVLGSFRIDSVLDKETGAAPPSGQEPWFFGRYGWVTSEPRISNTVACKGALGLWRVPDDLLRALVLP